MRIPLDISIITEKYDYHDLYERNAVLIASNVNSFRKVI